eukprot:CAMPEP_0177662156 /NCGR_PEP_ID=MMETSP0447-20121125/19114_1 /TAXON_ID=0 /ORGANISM="Stygamoeba regulata, Strain BSH-02190019" /LENGTH=94 /DNA_ID=CAMNT_0019167651 /DNA_START=237 /DNA_END=521 /DNA_ORIENTATION=-
MEIRELIEQKLTESGEREKLKDLLRSRLVECGWRDEMKNYCREIIKNKGLENVTVDSLIEEITPKARGSVPSNVKQELLTSIRKFLMSTSAQPS